MDEAGMLRFYVPAQLLMLLYHSVHPARFLTEHVMLIGECDLE
jgi:hypothetical protein